MKEDTSALIHPVLKDDYAIFTPPIDKLFEQVTVWLDNMVPGAFVYGKPRMGKTRCIKFWLNDLLQEHYSGDVLIYKMNCKSYQNYSESHFLDDMIYSLKGNVISITRTTTKPKKYNLAINHIATEVLQNATSRIIFVIDEAQNLPEQGYRWLCNFQNELDELGLRITFLLVGSPEIYQQATVFKQTKQSQIVGRFMLHSCSFRGISSKQQLEYVLDGYDEDSEWPAGSDVSFTEYFFPNAFKNGFRIKSYSDHFWHYYIENTKLDDKHIEVAMEHIGKAINFLFRKHGDINIEYFSLQEKDIYEAIEYTQYKEYMLSMY